MHHELYLLIGAALLALVQLSAAIFVLKRDVGNDWTIGTRDDAPPAKVSPLWGRLDRAHKNMMETLPLFAIGVLLVAVEGRYGTLSVWGAHLYFWARLAYLPAYLSGIKWVRTSFWQVAMIGMIMVYMQLFV